MMNFSPQFLSLIRKPLFFGICGALGCLLAAMLLGEPLLYFTKRAPSPEPPPQAIALLIDCSGSMDENNKLTEAKAAATSFIQRQDLNRNRFTVIGFGNQVHTPTALGASAPELIQGIANLSDGGGTDMTAGIRAAADALQAAGQIQTTSGQPNRGILLFTDGQPASAGATKMAAKMAKMQGINLVAVATGQADVNYLAELTGDRSLVFYANSGQFDQAFQAAEKQLYSQQLVESEASGQYGLVGSLARTGCWTGLLSVGISVALICGQNRYLHKPLLTPQAAGLGLGGGFAAGLAAGGLGQLLLIPTTHPLVVGLVSKLLIGIVTGGVGAAIASLFMPKIEFRTAVGHGGLVGGFGSIGYTFLPLYIGDFWVHALTVLLLFLFLKADFAWTRLAAIALAATAIAHLVWPVGVAAEDVASMGRVAGWTILGLFLGGGMSAFIPNLKFQKALLGGGVGGLIGVVMFMAVSGLASGWAGQFVGDIVGRLMGAAALGFCIGLMIALIEQLVLQKEARLIVHWSANETRPLALGVTPIVLGSSRDAHVPLPKSDYPPITAKVFLQNQEIIMEFDPEMQRRTSMKKLRHILKHGDRRKFGKVQIEVVTAT